MSERYLKVHVKEEQTGPHSFFATVDWRRMAGVENCGFATTPEEAFSSLKEKLGYDEVRNEALDELVRASDALGLYAEVNSLESLRERIESITPVRIVDGMHKANYLRALADMEKWLSEVEK